MTQARRTTPTLEWRWRDRVDWTGIGAKFPGIWGPLALPSTSTEQYRLPREAAWYLESVYSDRNMEARSYSPHLYSYESTP